MKFITKINDSFNSSYNIEIKKSQGVNYEIKQKVNSLKNSDQSIVMASNTKIIKKCLSCIYSISKLSNKLEDTSVCNKGSKILKLIDNQLNSLERELVNEKDKNIDLYSGHNKKKINIIFASLYHMYQDLDNQAKRGCHFGIFVKLQNDIISLIADNFQFKKHNIQHLSNKEQILALLSHRDKIEGEILHHSIKAEK